MPTVVLQLKGRNYGGGKKKTLNDQAEISKIKIKRYVQFCYLKLSRNFDAKTMQIRCTYSKLILNIWGLYNKERGQIMLVNTAYKSLCNVHQE